MPNSIKIMYFGDLFGRKGLKGFEKFLQVDEEFEAVDHIFVNGENVAGGKGITKKEYEELKDLGVLGITTGNHVYNKEKIYGQIKEMDDLIRPMNYGASAPGQGYKRFVMGDYNIFLVNLNGRVFMPEFNNPFTIFSKLMLEKEKDDIVICDFHGEATSEKIAFSYAFDGVANVILGTHTHVQTNDLRVLPKGTLYLSDLGMVGSIDGIIGSKKESIINHFQTHLPFKVEVEDKGDYLVNGVYFEICKETKKILDYKLINKIISE